MPFDTRRTSTGSTCRGSARWLRNVAPARCRRGGLGHTGPLPPVPEAMHQLRVEKRSGGTGVRVWVGDLKGLLGLIEMDVVELHPWPGGRRSTTWSIPN